MRSLLLAKAVVFLALLAPLARAGDTFYRVPVTSLKITEGELPKGEPSADHRWGRNEDLRSYATLDGQGEAYLTGGVDSDQHASQWSRQTPLSDGVLVARAPQGAPLTGWIFVPNSDSTALVPVKFAIDTSAASTGAKTSFFTAKESYYSELQSSAIPGAAWFRRQADDARAQLGEEAQNRQAIPWRSRSDVESTYDLFSGGRAISDNLQLSRALPAAPANKADDEKLVPLSDLKGITVDAINWPDTPGDHTATDPLAAVIPADQHAAFLPSFDALMTLTDAAAGAGLPIYRSFAQISEDGKIVERYERQLGLHPGALSRLLGAKVVQSVAITGSDPYFDTGTDVAILFQTPSSETLMHLLAAEVRADTAPAHPKPGSGEAGGIAYVSMLTPDRAISSYVASINDTTVVVTNSLAQLASLAAVKSAKNPAIASLPEYRFFRARYAVGDAGETGFLFLSDATIRRWCGPEWRIGASRRLRAAAILSDLTAEHLDELVSGVAKEHAVAPGMPMRTIGDVTLAPGGPRSSVYGSLAFLTPIAELGITDATADEAASYKRWRDTYQQNWSWAFDPIGVSFFLSPARASADLTVMPLILGSGYKMFVDVARGVSISPGSGDPHDALFHAVMAVNREAHALTEGAGMLRTMAPGVEIDPLGWLGKSVAFYADPDPFWTEMLASGDRDFVEKHFDRLPVALNAEVGSVLKLTAFISAARAYIEQSSPGMLAWENRDHNGHAYVRVGLTEKAREGGEGAEFDKAAVFYAATPRALIVSLNEDVVKRALDRQSAQKDDAPVQKRPWLGSSLCMQITRQGLSLTAGAGGTTLREAAQHRAWANIPILNEWKRRYPDKDPVALHEAKWGDRLVSPGGGEYRWNERFRTMESSVYGHPGDPKPGPDGAGPLEGIEAGNFGITFEDNGLRAKAILDRTPAPH